MSASATINRAAAVLREISPTRPAQTVLREYLDEHRDWSPLEQKNVVAAVHAFARWRTWHEEEGGSLQARLTTALALQERFVAHPHTIKTQALAARAVPAWIKAEIDPLPAGWLRQLQAEPALWIRARLSHVGHVVAKVGDCEPAPLPPALPTAAPAALRYTGCRDLFRHPSFGEGQFEIQDLASQLVGHACAPQPGETWWDACAGEGGKTLHLSDLLLGKGLVWATDRSTRRLAQLEVRARRAKAFNYRIAPWEGDAQHLPTKAKFDGVLLDAPCSGVGTWQRHPEARWTTRVDDVIELAAVQARLLEAVAGAVKPGGRLVYAVCTLTRTETSVIANSFTARHPEFEPVAVFPLPDGGLPGAAPVSSASPESISTALPPPALTPGAATQVTLWPHEVNANGMFIATWRRRS